MNGLCEQCQLFFPVPDDFAQGVPYLCPQCQATLVPFEEDDSSANGASESASAAIDDDARLSPPETGSADTTAENGKGAKVIWFFPQPSPEVEAARARRQAEAQTDSGDASAEPQAALGDSLFEGLHDEDTLPGVSSQAEPGGKEDGEAPPPWASSEESSAAAAQEDGSLDSKEGTASGRGRFQSNYSMKGAGSGEATREELPIGAFPGAARPPPAPEEELPELDLTPDEDLPITKDVGPALRPPRRRKPLFAAASAMLVLGVGGFWVYSGGLDTIQSSQDDFAIGAGEPESTLVSGVEDAGADEPDTEVEEASGTLDVEGVDSEETPSISTEPPDEAEPAGDVASTQEAPPAREVDRVEPSRPPDRRKVAKTKTGTRSPPRERVVKRSPPEPPPAPEATKEPPAEPETSPPPAPEATKEPPAEPEAPPPPEPPPTKAPATKAPVTEAAPTKAPPEPPPTKAPAEEPEQPSPAEQAREHLRSGSRLLQQGQAEAAIAEFEKAIALDENNAQAHRGLGIANASLGRGGAAARHYETYLRLRPNARDAAQVQQIIDAYYASQE